LAQSLALATGRRNAGAHLPLYGVPFSVKDNIDVQGLPTTAGCPAFRYIAARSAPVVVRLIEAGAILLGKTNLDQFATGLSGVRSPYGICKNPFNNTYISGGSSSGSAVAVATGLGCFSLGTDTAGSGRVPAGLNNIVGLKPTRGALSTRGVVPACRSLDCVSIFAVSCSDAQRVFDVAAHYDAEDPQARVVAFNTPAIATTGLRVGVPQASQLQFFGDDEAQKLYEGALERFVELGATTVEIDFAPFLAAADLLYSGPWVAERLLSAGKLLESQPEALEPAVRQILHEALVKTALDAFRGQYRLAELRRASEAAWRSMDVLLVPTTPTTFSIEEMAQEPIAFNTRLGYYTNFVNLFDLCALAIPAGFRGDGLPLGVTLIGPASADAQLLAYGSHFLEEPR
jgi:allophanate hydrolase